VDDSQLVGLHRYYTKEGEPTGTFYAENDRNGRAKATNSIYDRKKRLEDLKQTSKADLKKNPYEERLELRLYQGNCQWLHLDNIRGTYYDVFERYLPLLGTYYHNYFEGNISITGRGYKELRRVIKVAGKKGTSEKIRYRGSGLKKTPHGQQGEVGNVERTEPQDVQVT
jgi:hypothetical protein